MTSSFLQVGRTIKCGHCSPNFEWIPPETCQCICHNICIRCGKVRPSCTCEEFVSGEREEPDFKVALTGDRGCPHLHLEDMQAFLPMFISDKNGKIDMSEKGKAILHVTLFLDWCKKNVKCK
jgi:hypothetical protein